jgi:thiamine kinase-like enzyme
MTKAIVVQHPLTALNGNSNSSDSGRHRKGDGNDSAKPKTSTTKTTTNDIDTHQLLGKEEWTEYRNNAEKILDIRIDTSSVTRDEQIRHVVAVLCPFLRLDGHDAEDRSYSGCREDHDDHNDDDSEDSGDSEGSDLQIKPLTGGLSNHLFIVSATSRGRGRQQHLPLASVSVLVRVHPETSPGSSVEIVHREWENRFAAWLAAQNNDGGMSGSDTSKRLAPTVYGRFENGRVEEFYPNVKPLTWGQMKDYAPQIAASLADFHRLDAPSHVLPKPSEIYRTRGAIYETTEAWMEAATRLVQEASRVEDGSHNHASLLVRELQEQWTWLKQQLFDGPQPSSMASATSLNEKALSFIREVVVTHMDCQPLNILIEDSSATAPTSCKDSSSSKLASVHLIDFEYSGWNPIAADIANTFCEYCEMSNLRANYELEYPSRHQQDLFFWHYVRRADPALADTLTNNECSRNDWDVFSTTLQREVGRFSLLSHLSWAAWSIIKSFEEDGVDFDYMAYAAHRMDGYAWAKDKFCCA